MEQQSGIISATPPSTEKRVLTFPSPAGEGSDSHVLINGWQIRPAENRLVNGQSEIRLEPKSMDLLLRLAAARGNALSRSELISALWPNVYASDDSLNRVVSRLRRSLAQDEVLATAVVTVPKRGYRLKKRFIEAAVNGAQDGARPGNARSDPDRKTYRWPMVFLGIASLCVVLAAIAAIMSNRAQPANYVEFQSMPLTKMVGRENGARFSPDGERVTYSWDKEGAQSADIYVQKIAEFAPQRITQHSLAEFNPAWSPDGRELAFVRTNFSDICEIVTINLQNMIETVIHHCNAGNGVDISWGGAAQNIFFTDRIGATGPFAVHRLDMTTKKAQQVTFPASSDLGDFIVRIAPNGEELAFVRRTNYVDADVYVAAKNGEHIRQVTEDQRNISGLSWDADNTHLFFTTNRASAFGLWRTSKNDRRIEPVPSVLGDANSVTVSPDGARVVYEKRRLNSKVHKISLSNAELDSRPYTNDVSSADQFSDISPNGKRLAYISDRSGEAKLWIAGIGDADARPVDIDVDLLMSASWSPDSKQLLVGGFANRDFGLYLITVENGIVQRLTAHPSADYNPTWSSDGMRAYFTSNRTGRFEIWCINIDTGFLEQITMNGGHRALEGDGNRLVFAKKKSDGLFELDLTAANRQERRLTDGLSALDWRNWDIAGEELFYVVRENKHAAVLRRFNLATGVDEAMRKLDNIPLQSGLSVTPDGTSAYVTTIVSAEADLIMLERLAGK